MKVNPEFIERQEGDDLVLFNRRNRATLLLPAPKADGYRAMKEGRAHTLAQSDINVLIEYGVISEGGNFSRLFRRTLGERLTDAHSLYDFYTKPFYPHKAPLGLLWSITQRCNLHCPYCHASSKSKDYDELSLNYLLTIADKLTDAGVFEIVLNGGEPFLRKDIFDLIEYLKNKNVLLSVNTNGTRIDALKAARLAELSMIVGVSIDGPDENVNSLTRGKGVFRHTLEGIRALVDAGVTTHILTTVTRLNFDSIPDILRLTRSLGLCVQTLQDLHPAGYGRATFEELKLTPEQEDAVLPLLKQLANDFPDVTINTTELSYFAYHPIVEQHVPDQKRPLHLFQCTACTETLYIDAAGNLYPCVALPDMPMGNLLDEDFSTCWQDSIAARTVRTASKLPVSTIDMCRDCHRNYICTGGCRGDAIAVYNDWFAAHPRCPRRRH